MAVAMAITLLCAATTLMRLPEMPLKRAIGEAIMPILQNLSLSHGNSSWSFAYRDDNTSVQLCTGYSNLELKTPCSTTDPYAWGSTTKTMTALLILRLVEQGKIKSLDESLVSHANEYLKKISNGQQDLISLFGREIEAVTLRHLLQMTSGIPEYDSNGVREYQNEHRDEDLSPLWILNQTGKEFSFPPGTSGQYSSTNYVLLGLVAAVHQEQAAADWDKLDQSEWMRGNSTHLEKAGDSTSYPSFYASFPTVRYATHSECRNFTTATGTAGHTIHGYQRANFHRKVPPNESDVYNMSCLQGWTCA